MEPKSNKTPFPGQNKGLVRVLVKRNEKEEFYQLQFDLFADEETKS